MRQNIQGIPSTVEVDGKTYPVRYTSRAFKVDLNAKTQVYTEKLSDLPEKIRLAEADLADQREFERKDRAAKREQEKKVPAVQARLRSTGEIVQVRGKSTKGRAWDEKYLVTRANGKKETVSVYNLLSLSSDEAALDKIEAEEKAVKAELVPITEVGRLDRPLRILQQATLDIVYDDRTDTFVGTFDGLTATASNPSTVEDSIVLQAISRERPWSTVHEDGVTSVISTLTGGKTRYAGYEKAWLARMDAERYAALQNQLVALSQRRTLASETFDYWAELAAVQAKS